MLSKKLHSLWFHSVTLVPTSKLTFWNIFLILIEIYVISFINTFAKQAKTKLNRFHTSGVVFHDTKNMNPKNWKQKNCFNVRFIVEFIYSSFNRWALRKRIYKKLILNGNFPKYKLVKHFVQTHVAGSLWKSDVTTPLKYFFNHVLR